MIVNLLGINKSIFLDSIFLSQGANTNLASLTPTARKERLEILTNTDSVINSFKDKLKSRQIEYESKCVDWEKLNAEIEGKITTLLAQEDIYRKKITEIDEQIAYRESLGNLDLIETQIENIQKVIEDKKVALKNSEDVISNKRSEIDSVKENNKNLLEKRNEKDREYQEERLNLTGIEAKRGMEEIKIHNLNEDIADEESEIQKIVKSDRCPTCGRKYDDVNEEHIQQVVDEHKIVIEKLKLEIESKENEILKYKEDEKQQAIIIENKLKELNILKEELSKANEVIDGLDSDLSSLEEDRKTIQKNINDCESDLENLRNKKDSILKIQVGNKQEFENLLQESARHNLELQEEKVNICKSYDEDNNCVGTLKHCQQLVTKEFRTYLLRNSINYLNELLRQYSEQLFSNDKDIIVIKGDDTKLDINLGDASYESLSGGEKTRVNIALLLAQKSLANALGNISCNIIILDEVLGYCDSFAEANVINLLTKELNSLETIFMISHKEIQIGYDSELVVRKATNGLSSIINR